MSERLWSWVTRKREYRKKNVLVRITEGAYIFWREIMDIRSVTYNIINENMESTRWKIQIQMEYDYEREHDMNWMVVLVRIHWLLEGATPQGLSSTPGEWTSVHLFGFDPVRVCVAFDSCALCCRQQLLLPGITRHMNQDDKWGGISLSL
jgi:hypothetical protein